MKDTKKQTVNHPDTTLDGSCSSYVQFPNFVLKVLNMNSKLSYQPSTHEVAAHHPTGGLGGQSPKGNHRFPKELRIASCRNYLKPWVEKL